jgi:poly(A) polymerase
MCYQIPITRFSMPIPHDQIDPDAEKVVRRLARNGFAAYLVGGCVRDLLLGRTPKDFDVATSATPQEIKALFRNCRIIGRRFRLAHIFFGSKIIETSTFRANPREVEADELVENVPEGASLPAAEPAELLIRRDNVFGTAEEDARRRDFTINGLFYDLDADKVIDYVEGLPDLEKRTVRTIGDPQIRFREDPVRILRAIKFAARLDFTIEPASYQAILDHRGEIAKCAPPRVLEEIYRLLRGGAAQRSLELLDETGVLEVLIPELGKRLRSDDAVRIRLLQTLNGVDYWVRSGGTPTNALLLSSILAPFLVDFLYDQEPPGAPRVDPFQLLEERVRPILDGMRSSRRDTERGRQILLAQRRLMPSKRRRSRPMALVRRDWFDEALALFQIMHPNPQGEVADELQRWQRLRHEGHAPPPHGPHGQPHAHAEGQGEAHADGPPKRRRRRRGGRRRRRPEASAANNNGSEGSPTSEAKPDDKNYGW